MLCTNVGLNHDSIALGVQCACDFGCHCSYLLSRHRYHESLASCRDWQVVAIIHSIYFCLGAAFLGTFVAIKVPKNERSMRVALVNEPCSVIHGVCLGIVIVKNRLDDGGHIAGAGDDEVFGPFLAFIVFEDLMLEVIAE